MTTPRIPTGPMSWLDLKIPLWGIMTLIMGLVAQSAALLIWGTNLSNATTANTAAIADLQLKAANVASLRETVARIDERTTAMAVSVNHLADSRDANGAGR